MGLCTFLTWLLLKLSPRFKNGFVFLFVKAARALGFDSVIDGLEPNGICDEPGLLNFIQNSVSFCVVHVDCTIIRIERYFPRSTGTSAWILATS